MPVQRLLRIVGDPADNHQLRRTVPVPDNVGICLKIIKPKHHCAKSSGGRNVVFCALNGNAGQIAGSWRA
jgi:hypothetical protein